MKEARHYRRQALDARVRKDLNRHRLGAPNRKRQMQAYATAVMTLAVNGLTASQSMAKFPNGAFFGKVVE